MPNLLHISPCFTKATCMWSIINLKGHNNHILCKINSERTSSAMSEEIELESCLMTIFMQTRQNKQGNGQKVYDFELKRDAHSVI